MKKKLPLCKCGRPGKKTVWGGAVCDRCVGIEGHLWEYHTAQEGRTERIQAGEEPEEPEPDSKPEVPPGPAGLVIKGAYRDYGL